MDSTIKKYLCMACNTEKPESEFSGSQLKRNKQCLKCRSCVESSSKVAVAPPPTVVSGFPSHNQVLVQQQIQIPVVPLDDFQQQLIENQRLKQENLRLKAQLESVNKKILNLGLPSDMLKRLQESETLVQKLRSENETLFSDRLSRTDSTLTNRNPRFTRENERTIDQGRSQDQTLNGRRGFKEIDFRKANSGIKKL
jgi:hypothetical protein